LSQKRISFNGHKSNNHVVAPPVRLLLKSQQVRFVLRPECILAASWRSQFELA
jgi:hypothetical protein